MTKRHVFSTLPVAARVLLEDVYESTGHPAHNWWNPLWDEPVYAIAENYGINPQVAKAYLQRFAKLVGTYRRQYAITLFVYNDKWENREPCVDVRFGHMYLPRETFPIGFLHRGRALLDPPALDTQEQCDQLLEVVIEALVRAGDMGAEEKAVTLISKGFVEIDHYWGLPKLYRPKVA